MKMSTSDFLLSTDLREVARTNEATCESLLTLIKDARRGAVAEGAKSRAEFYEHISYGIEIDRDPTYGKQSHETKPISTEFDREGTFSRAVEPRATQAPKSVMPENSFLKDLKETARRFPQHQQKMQNVFTHAVAGTEDPFFKRQYGAAEAVVLSVKDSVTQVISHESRATSVSGGTFFEVFTELAQRNPDDSEMLGYAISDAQLGTQDPELKKEYGTILSAVQAVRDNAKDSAGIEQVEDTEMRKLNAAMEASGELPDGAAVHDDAFFDATYLSRSGKIGQVHESTRDYQDDDGLEM